MGSRSAVGRVLVSVALVGTGCSGGSGGFDDVSVPVASDLAPSQLVGSTVPEPVTPVPCEVGDLELWTAQAAPGLGSPLAVIRIRNAGDVRCDADISNSANLDPLVEPDVWLDRGATADLIVGDSPTDCTSPAVVTNIDVSIGDAAIDVQTVFSSCGWAFTAFYPNDPVRDACERDSLELATTLDGLVVRNSSSVPCALGGIVEISGAVAVADPTAAPMPDVAELMPGDVVAFGRRSGDDCEGSGVVELHDDRVGPLVFDDVACDLEFQFGGGRPWFGSVDSGEPTDSLNPFGDPA